MLPKPPRQKRKTHSRTLKALKPTPGENLPCRHQHDTRKCPESTVSMLQKPPRQKRKTHRGTLKALKPTPGGNIPCRHQNDTRHSPGNTVSMLHRCCRRHTAQNGKLTGPTFQHQNRAQMDFRPPRTHTNTTKSTKPCTRCCRRHTAQNSLWSRLRHFEVPLALRFTLNSTKGNFHRELPFVESSMKHGPRGSPSSFCRGFRSGDRREAGENKGQKLWARETGNHPLGSEA